MKTLANIARRFRKEEDGAAMVEYSVLIGIITAAAIAFIVLIGGWVTLQWNTLCDNVKANAGAACP
jgi:pilus assembly protein Flp/PilA